MKIYGYMFFAIFQVASVMAQYSNVEWIATTETQQWVSHPDVLLKPSGDRTDAELLVNKGLQTVEGFGACFNELGWTSLSKLSEIDRQSIFKELFAPEYGACFNICRMPVGANDFSRDWYSYNEMENDFHMTNFSIANDLQTLVPFIKRALGMNPDIKIWASPWSPPSWMKRNKRYYCEPGNEGTDMFIQKDEYLKSYALYFEKFIQEYRNQGIKISTIMPQNEFNSCQGFPSCTWTATGLANFIGNYLGPTLEKQKIEIMLGTVERANRALVDAVLNDQQAGRFVKGVGFQWAGKGAIPGIHKSYPRLKLYQTEQECGDGKNEWSHCCHAWDLMKHYFSNGVSAYMYWNISLEKGGSSHWGWKQNSLITVDASSKTYHFNYEYYLMKHFSHFIRPGAVLIQNTGKFSNFLAFLNPDKSIVLVAQNDANEARAVTFKVGGSSFSVVFEPRSFNTIRIK